MLIRFASHKRWILLVALVSAGAILAAWLTSRSDPEGLTGGSRPGLWFGVAAVLCMVLAGVLPLLRRRQVLRWRWVGQRQTWLRMHIWLGLLSVVFVVLHSGWRFRGELVFVLSWVFFLTILTGLMGLSFQEWLPRQLTRDSSGEVPLGQLPEVCRRWRENCDDAVDTVCGPPETSEPAAPQDLLTSAGHIRAFYEEQVRPFLRPDAEWRASLRSPDTARKAFAVLREGRDLTGDQAKLVTELEKHCAWRRTAARQQRLQAVLHGWLLLHISLSAALLVLVVAHVLSALWY